MMTKFFRILGIHTLAISLLLSLTTCSEDGSFNVFSIEDDIQLGQQVRDEILNNPQEYPILSETTYPEAYTYLRGIRDKILATEEVRYRDRFAWEVRIIQDDNTLNAFVTPGGYIFVYTGLIKFLDTEDQLAGVMGHEVAHADRRHSTNNLSRRYGVGILLDMLLGNNTSLLGQITRELSGSLAGLSFSRDSEREADEYSVIYLANTEYQCNGAAGFFEKILSQGGNNNAPPTWLSTHPASDDRVMDINDKAGELSCDTSPSGLNYTSFQNMLP